MHSIPTEAKVCRLILVRVFQYASDDNKDWNDDQMLTVLTGYAAEVFLPDRYTFLTSAVQPYTFGIVLQTVPTGHPNENMDRKIFNICTTCFRFTCPIAWPFISASQLLWQNCRRPGSSF